MSRSITKMLALNTTTTSIAFGLVTLGLLAEANKMDNVVVRNFIYYGCGVGITIGTILARICSTRFTYVISIRGGPVMIENIDSILTVKW